MSKKIAVLALTAAVMLSACQKTPEKVKENENGVKISDEVETVLNLESETTITSEKFEVPDHISETYTEEDYSVNIESDIVLPTTSVTSGDLTAEEISLEKMKDVLNPNADWVKRERGYYVLLPEAQQSTENVDYSICLENSAEIEGQVKYDIGYTDDFPAAAEYIEKSLWTDEQASFYEQAKSYAESILQALGYSYSITGGELYGTQDNMYASYSFCYGIDGIPTVDISSMGEDSAKSTIGQIDVTTDQVGSLTINGDYSVAESVSCELLSMENILKCFVASVGQGNAGKLLETVNITKIQLEYWVNEDLSYVPVWTFYNTMEETGNLEVPITCIHAETGEVLYQW